eukprot:TRINITY_DN1190_c0_g1_i4.p3 TRINITY_DN1190_c0_g1~~TRINITY_DN1190_c0_g1_i4.p3  ORF type:complete len:144 (+),score=42.81 TRINITY_DN1190_c0_g1_i4:148-579(+)
MKVKDSSSACLTRLLDKSGSMGWGLNGPEWKDAPAGKARWDEARTAVAELAPFVCRCDPDGVSLWFFSAGPPQKIPNVKTKEHAMAAFAKHKPGGGTDLAGVLKAAINEHFAKKVPKHETMMIITDGKPDSEPAEIVAAMMRV